MSNLPRTPEQRQEAFLDDYEKLCRAEGFYLGYDAALHPVVSEQVLRLHLHTIRMKTRRQQADSACSCHRQ